MVAGSGSCSLALHAAARVGLPWRRRTGRGLSGGAHEPRRDLTQASHRDMWFKQWRSPTGGAVGGRGQPVAREVAGARRRRGVGREAVVARCSSDEVPDGIKGG